MSQLCQMVIGVISKPPALRRDIEIDAVLPWLRKRSDLLRTIEKDVLMKMVRGCSYQKVVRDDVILVQGEKGDSFYIMLTGKTSIYIDTSKSDDDPVTAKPKDPETPDLDKELLEEWEEEKRRKTGKKKKLDRSRYGRFIISFEAGKCFGEIALMSEDAVRNATIISDDETDLLVINRELFNSTVKAKQEEEYEERKTFINSCPLFSHWNAKFKRLLEMSIRKEVHPFGSYIVKQGEPVLGLHFIIRGQAKITVHTDSHKQQYPRLFDARNTALAKELGTKFKRKEEKTKESIVQEQVRVRRRQGYAAAEKRLSDKSTTVCVVDENEVIGDTELVLGLETYAQSFVCTANAEVFILDTKNIDRLIHKKNPHTIAMLRTKVENKLRGRRNAQLGAGVELYGHLSDKLEESKKKSPGAQLALLKEEEEAEASKETAESQSAAAQTIADKVRDRDLMVSQLVKLFLQGKTPLIEPSVAGTVYYRTKSLERAKRQLSDKLREKAKMEKEASGELRLQRARKAARRQARSRRELEKLTIAQDPEEMKTLQDKNHAVNRILNQAGASAGGKIRPATAFSRSESSRALLVSRERPQSAMSTSTAGGDRIFRLTEPNLDDTDADQVALGYEDMQNTAVKHIVREMGGLSQARNASRAHIVCSMIEQQTHQHSNSIQALLRPKSAPVPRRRGYGYYPDEEEDYGGSFDRETSDEALQDLEERIRTFHDRQDNDGRKAVVQVPELRRFSIHGPEDVPIPGGTVYVQQRSCKYPPGTYVNTSHHQHTRRFMIPKNAFEIASRSMTALSEANKDSEDSTVVSSKPPRPKSSKARRVQSAPAGHLRRNRSLVPVQTAW